MLVMNRNDKNKKFTPLNINNVFKGKSVEPQNKPSFKLGGMQNIGKVSSMRRVPPPKWVPSIKAETGVSDGRQIINQSTSGWVNPVSSQENSELNNKPQGITSKIGPDRSQWNSKLTTNKPFFLIGQEFPSLQPDTGHESSQDNTNKDKFKDTDSKSKIDELRNRDTNISASTLNRIDALSISKSTKGDIAATGWAAEDEEPNFDEKIVFSDEESSNEIHNWHSDNEEGNKSERCDKHESIDIPTIISDVWHDQNQVMRFPQFQQMQVPMNVQGQFINPQYPTNILNRNPSCTISNMGDEQAAFMNSVAEKRNARNMEYIYAIERARQKKLATQSSRGSCGINDDHNQIDQALIRSRHTSMTSDTAESMNTPIEMGPPGGPPMMHHLHKPHLQPQISPMIHSHNISVISPSIPPQSIIRFAPHSYNIMPISAVPMDVDTKLMEKFVEFLKLQTNNEVSGDITSAQIEQAQQPTIMQETDVKVTNIVNIPSITDNNTQNEQERPQSHLSSLSQVQIEKENNAERPITSITKDNDDADRDLQKKSKSNYSHEEDSIKYDQSKKGAKNKNFKEYRPNKSVYKGEYSNNPGGSGGNTDRDYYAENNDEMAYEDYNTYKQHYSRDYKPGRGYTPRNNTSYSYYPDQYSSQSRDNNYATDYHYKSNSLKSKSSSKSKEQKSPGLNADHCQSDRDSSKKYTSDNQEIWPHDNDITDVSDKKGKDTKKTSKPSKTASYPSKKFEARHYKEKSNETPQEYSMGFAVNPKENRKNYYSSNYSRRYYPDYKYYNTVKYGEYENDDNYYPESYYPQDSYYQYDKDLNYSSNKYTNKRSTKSGSNTGESWRPNKEEKSNNHRNNSETTNSTNTSSNPINQSKNVNRNNRKSDKRQFSTTKDNNNDNDQDEWETASEGGSVRSSSAPRDLHKMHNRQNNCQLNTNENKSISNNNAENRKATMNKTGSSYSCNMGNNSFNDNNGNQDGNGGASGSSGGNRFRSNVSQSRSGDSSQNKNMEKTSNNENRNSDSTSKNCSNNNNISKENSFNVLDSNKLEIVQRTSIDNTNISPTINFDKFSEFLEDEDVLFENSQFQEVLSKATKKSRKLEEQRRLKEEYKLEQKRIEAIKFKSKTESNQNRKSTNRRDQPQRSNKSEITIHKYENKAISNMREKEVSNNTFKKWDTNKVSMQIGSWDNSLADEISSEKKAPPKPIGTPASTVPWNKKVKGSFETNATNNCQHTLSNESIKLSTDIETVAQPFSSENAEVNFNTTLSYSYNNAIYNSAVRTSEENKIDSSIEAQNSEIVIHENINFEYEVKNINCDKSHRNLLSTDRNVQNNDQKLLNDKINSVKTIWDSLPVSNIPAESKVTISSPSINQDLDIHTGPVTINQDVSNTRNIDNNLTSPPVPIPNVCKVKPQLQHDFKKDHNEIIIPSQTFPIRNSPAAFLSQNQGGFLPYHRFPEYLSETLHATDGYSSLISNSQPGMHINYNLSNTHLIDSSLLRQNTQEQINKQMNFINHTQSSYYPQQATTPKLMSNTAQLPINMDMGSGHAPPHHMQQLLLTRQNSLTSSMMQPNPMTIPFIQSGQQPIQAQTPIFPTTPLLGATNFSSQMNPFSQTHLQPHYPHGNFPSLHHTPQFQPNQQMLLNQHQHHQQQQLIQAPLSHDRVINSGGQSGVFNSVIGPSDISTNTGLTDFNGQPKSLAHHNNIMHGMSGSAFVLPHNLNILMKPSMFATNSQYNTFTTPIQSNLLNLKNGFDHNTNIKSLDLDHYRHDNSINDRNIYCGDNTGLQKPNDEYYQDVSEYDNCDMNYDNWVPNLRYSKVDIYTANNLMPTFDFHSQKSPMQFSPLEAGGDAATYRNFITSFRDNHSSLAAAGLPTNTSLQYIISPRIKPQYNQEQPVMISKQHSKCYDNLTYIPSNNFISKNESTDNKISIKSSTCSNSINEAKDGLSKDISNIEKSITENKKNSKQRTSYSDNFDEKNQTWSLMEDDRSVPPEDNRSSIKSSNTENSSHSPIKHFNNSRPSNTFDSQCQYGYDETQLSSQTAESLRKFDQDQLKKVIMKLREGPVMTDNNCNEFDFTSYKGATIPRLMPLQSSRSKPSNKSFNNYNNSFPSDNYGSENVGLGFYSRNRALTPPAAHFRTYRNKTNRHANSLIPNNASINRVTRQKCDTNNTDVDSNDLKLNNVQSKSLECDNLVLENIIDNSIL